MGKRRRARELALQFLYQCDMNPPPSSESGEGGSVAVYDGSDAPRMQDAEAVDTDGRASVSRDRIEEAITNFWHFFKTDSDARSFFTVLVVGTCKHLDEIDRIINDVSRNWKLDRMAVVDRNIIRCAVFELLYLADIPPNVTINEAVEIAKRYGTEDSPGFINGILDRIAEEITDKNSQTGPVHETEKPSL
ncbi:MAG: transcription antitermination factor NusB [Deltaproteobacteria bacterium]|nr:transcription antitermination factor NusB [Candidatus Zymogenaceae bacterium]